MFFFFNVDRQAGVFIKIGIGVEIRIALTLKRNIRQLPILHTVK